MVTNEDLVELFNGTKSEENRNIIFKELFKRLGSGTKSICGYYAKLLKERTRDFIEEAEQECMICMLNCFKRYNRNKNVKFITFYYTCLQHHLFNFYKSVYALNISEFSNTEYIEECKTDLNLDKLEDNIDSDSLYSLLDKELNKIAFIKPLHRKVFRDYIGFNSKKQDDDNFANIGRKYNYSRMAVKKICDRYMKQLVENIENDSNLSDKMRVFL